MSEVTKTDLWDVRDRLTERIDEGFAGVHRRQDITNGRVNTVEGEVKRHDERIKTLFRRLPTRSERPAEESGESRRITQREVLIAVGAVGATIAVIRLLPYLVHVVIP